jgi:hypothetical protein
MALGVERCIFINFDDRNMGVIDVLCDPIGRYKSCFA